MKRINYNIEHTIEFFLFLALAGILGNILHDVIMFFDHSAERTVFPLGTLLTIITLVSFMIYAESITKCGRFHLMISLGCTRREYFLGRLLETILELILSLAVTYACFRFETWKFDRFYQGIPVDSDFSGLFTLKYTIPFLLLIGAFAFTASVLILKFGTKALWGIWFLLMFVCVGFPRIIEKVGSFTVFEKVLTHIQHLDSILIGGCLLLSIILLFVNWCLISKQEVHM